MVMVIVTMKKTRQEAIKLIRMIRLNPAVLRLRTLVESGELGRIEDRRIEPIVDGILSVMRHLEMIDGEPSPTRRVTLRPPS